MNWVKKNFLVVMIISLFGACEEISDDIVNSQFLLISVENIFAPSILNYSQSNQDLTTSIELNYVNQIEQVWFTIKTMGGGEIIAEKVFMIDDGNITISGDAVANDNIYSGKYTMNDEISPGNYLIEYYVMNNIGYETSKTVKVATHNFYFDTGQANSAPVISDLNLPASINRDRSFTFSLRAEDPDGQTDIAGVYYEIYKPDGTIQMNSQGQTQFPMFDNGDVSGSGDTMQGDGIYSFKLTFPGSVQTGVWAFHFWARDNSGNISNLIIQNIEVN